MSLKSRLNKIETRADEINKDGMPIMVMLYADDNKEEILKSLKAKFGQDYKPRIIVRIPYRNRG